MPRAGGRALGFLDAAYVSPGAGILHARNELLEKLLHDLADRVPVARLAAGILDRKPPGTAADEPQLPDPLVALSQRLS
jgi:hypothetical protein